MSSLNQKTDQLSLSDSFNVIQQVFHRGNKKDNDVITPQSIADVLHNNKLGMSRVCVVFVYKVCRLKHL